ncbi:MAG: hypothetical protein U9O78_00395 [Patescibacteria group bacterium]|nr:hypothetical protein [Patescibacteria group bacterium]
MKKAVKDTTGQQNSEKQPANSPAPTDAKTTDTKFKNIPRISNKNDLGLNLN